MADSRFCEVDRQGGRAPGPRATVSAPLGVLFTLLVTMAGCTVNPVDQAVLAQMEREVIGETDPDIKIDVLVLTVPMQNMLDERILPIRDKRAQLRALQNLFFSSDELNIQYDPMAMRTAAQTFESRSGNCLSLTNLFVASARYLDLQAVYEIAEVRPTWDQQGKTLIRYEHVIASGQLWNGPRYVFDLLPEYAPANRYMQVITDNMALARHYNNLGARAIIEDNPDLARKNLRAAIWLDAGYSDAWNNMGTALRRLGRFDLAEFSYNRALDIDGRNFSAMSNLVMTLEEQGLGIGRMGRRVDYYRARNPYFQYQQAHAAFLGERYEVSRRLLEKSIRLKEDEPVFYAALAAVYEKLDDTFAAARFNAIAEALEEHTASFDPDDPARQTGAALRVW